MEKKKKIKKISTPEEIKDRFIQLSQKKGYIDGIYNYCDRWCEKCSFKAKCRNYSFSEDEEPGNGEELFEYLHNVFQATMLMLKDSMEETGIDPEELKNIEPVKDIESREHPLFQKCDQVAKNIHEWLQNNESAVNAAHLVQPDEEGNIKFNDAVDVIYWYNFFIPAKISRALSGLTEEEDDDEFSAYDSNGSAKIALIGLDRMIAAFSVVMKEIPSEEDNLLKILIDLAGIRKQTETIFPDARKFIRPGFDE